MFFVRIQIKSYFVNHSALTYGREEHYYSRFIFYDGIPTGVLHQERPKDLSFEDGRRPVGIASPCSFGSNEAIPTPCPPAGGQLVGYRRPEGG